MKPVSNRHQILAAIGQKATYADIERETGVSRKTLISSIDRLKKKGYVRRANPDARLCDIAIFTITSKGMEALEPEARVPEVGETMVQRAIRARPALATIWSAA